MLRLQALAVAASGCWAGGLGALHRQAAGFAAAAAAAHRQRQADLLVVHPAASPRHSLQEAIRLAESLTGGCDVVVGPLTGGTDAATAAPTAPVAWFPAWPPASMAIEAAAILSMTACYTRLLSARAR